MKLKVGMYGHFKIRVYREKVNKRNERLTVAETWCTLEQIYSIRVYESGASIVFKIGGTEYPVEDILGFTPVHWLDETEAEIEL